MKKIITYKIEKISDKTLSWFTCNEYPYIRTVVVDRERYIIKKIAFNFFILIDIVDEKYFDSLEEATIICDRLNNGIKYKDSMRR